MTDPEYLAWVQHHANLFYMHKEGDELLFAAWRLHVDHCTLAELTSASNLLVRDKPAFRADHLRQLLATVHSFRAMKNTEPLPVSPGCNICDGHGWIVGVLPHLSGIFDGEWRYPYYTVVVVCACAAGQRIHQAQVERFNELPVEKRHYRYRPCLTLEGYEQSNPFWREMIQRKESRERDRREADRIAREIDGKHPVGNAGALIQQTVARITKTQPVEEDLPF